LKPIFAFVVKKINKKIIFKGKRSLNTNIKSKLSLKNGRNGKSKDKKKLNSSKH
jgi:hypothetical protein